MANSENTLWIVTCIKWRNTRNGIPSIGHCDSRTYRREKFARDRYNAILNSIHEAGYHLVPIDVPPGEEYEGFSGRFLSKSCERYKTDYIVVFIDRNPTWDPRV